MCYGTATGLISPIFIVIYFNFSLSVINEIGLINKQIEYILCIVDVPNCFY